MSARIANNQLLKSQSMLDGVYEFDFVFLLKEVKWQLLEAAWAKDRVKQQRLREIEFELLAERRYG